MGRAGQISVNASQLSVAPESQELSQLGLKMINIKKIEFIASLPPITSAIQINGLGDGALIKLELPATEIYSIVQLQLYAGKIFKVTIEPMEDIKNGKHETDTNST